MNGKVVKWVSIGVSAAGAVLGFVGNVLDKKQQEETIAKEVAKQIANVAGKES